VTTICDGGDVTRKDGKKRMRQFGRVENPAGRIYRGAEDG
jgi:translation elongation factor EF-4